MIGKLGKPALWWLLAVPAVWLAGVGGGGWLLWRAVRDYLTVASDAGAEPVSRAMAAPVALWALLNLLGWFGSLAIVVAVFAERTKSRRAGP